MEFEVRSVMHVKCFLNPMSITPVPVCLNHLLYVHQVYLPFDVGTSNLGYDMIPGVGWDISPILNFAQMIFSWQ